MMKETKKLHLDIWYMQKSLRQARLALARDEVPVGAVVIDGTGMVVARSYNRMAKMHCQTGHAEMRAIERACKKRSDWRLDDCYLYVTLEPCLMCFGLIVLSRIKGLVYGATSPLFGCGLDNKATFPLYRKQLIIRGGVLQRESVSLLQVFFKRKRQEKGKGASV